MSSFLIDDIKDLIETINATPCSDQEVASDFSSIIEILKKIIIIIEGCCNPDDPDCDLYPDLKPCCNYVGLYMCDYISLYDANGRYIDTVYKWYSWTSCELECGDIVLANTDENCIPIITPDPCVQACRHVCPSSSSSVPPSGSSSPPSSSSVPPSSSVIGSSSVPSGSSSVSSSSSSTPSSSSSGPVVNCCSEMTEINEGPECYPSSPTDCASLSIDNYEPWCPGQSRTFTLECTGPSDCSPSMTVELVPNTPPSTVCTFIVTGYTPASGATVTAGPSKRVNVFWEDGITSPATFTFTVKWLPECNNGPACPVVRMFATRQNAVPGNLNLGYRWVGISP